MGLVGASLGRRWPGLAMLALSLPALLECRSQPEGQRPKTTPLASARPGGQLALKSSATAPQSVPAEPLPWAEALRSERFEEAERAFQALPSDAAQHAEVRFAWARTRLALGQPASAVALLVGLEQSLPALATQVVELRVKAMLIAGPPADAAKQLEQQSDPTSLGAAAHAWLAANEPERAFRLAERGLAGLAKGRAAGERERSLRLARGLAAMRLGKIGLSASDFRFLCVEAALSDEAKTAVAKLAELGEKASLAPADRLRRARSLAAAGRVAELESELAIIEPLGARLTKPGVFASLRGMALFAARGDYLAAEKLFQKASQLGTEDAAKELYYVARCRARAQDDRGAEAGFQQVIRRFGTTPWAEQAELSIARIHLTAGAFAKAVTAYGAYLGKRGGKARFIDDANYERAVALLAAGQAALATPLLERLAARTKDLRFEARLRELLAVALLSQGKRDQAVAAFQAVVRNYPLSFAALVAGARLRSLSASVPAWLTPAGAGLAPSLLELKLPPEVALLHRLGLDRDAAAAMADDEPRLTRSHAPRSGEALCELYGQLDVAERRYAIGQDAATRAGLDRAPGPRSRWMWDCVYPRPYPKLVSDAERGLLLPLGLLWSVMRQESGFRAGVRSPVGAVGLLQLMPATADKVAAELGEKFDPAVLTRADASVRFGAFYLRKLLDTFQGNVPLALAAYNAGPQAVQRWLTGAEGLELDLFVARIPYDETRGYVERVLGNHARYAYLVGGEEAVPFLELALPKPASLPENSY